MAKSSGAWNDSGNYVPARPKKSRQGKSQNTIISACLLYTSDAADE